MLHSSQELVRLGEGLATNAKVSRAANGRFWLPRLILKHVAESSSVVSDKQDGKTLFKHALVYPCRNNAMSC